MKVKSSDPEDSANAYHARLQAFVAPIAGDAGAVSDRAERDLGIAEAVYDAFGDLDAGQGLTRSQLVERCDYAHPDPAVIDDRIGLFIRMGMLQLAKRSQQRYQFNPEAASGLIVYGRLAEEGGVQEILTLLDRTRESISAGTATELTVAQAIHKVRRAFAINTAHLTRLVADRPLAELIEQRRHHRAADRLLRDAHGLIEQVITRFPGQAGAGDRLIAEATRYTNAVQDLVDRLLEENTRTRDFSMLDPEQYRTAAQVSTIDDLATPFERVLFDPPYAHIDGPVILDALDSVRPRRVRVRPAREEVLDSGPDPVEAARVRRARIREMRVRRAENALDSTTGDDLTSVLRAAGWPGAGQLIADLIALDADPEQPYALSMSDAILVDPTGPVSYVTPVSLHRVKTAVSGAIPGTQSVGEPSL